MLPNKWLWPVFALFLLLTGCVPSRYATYQVPIYDETPVSVEMLPPPMPIIAPQPKPSSGRPLIIIDPGHGGEDFGTKSNKPPRQHEKHLNLTTAQMLKSILVQQGFDVLMTRETDVFISLSGRAEFANAQKPLLFVSVHYNSAPSEKAEGIEVFYYNDEKDKIRMEESKALASAVLDSLLAHTKAKSRGVKQGNLAVIRETKMPAILIEGGFLTNDAEMQKLKDQTYLKSLATGIAEGIQKYAIQKKKYKPN